MELRRDDGADSSGFDRVFGHLRRQIVDGTLRPGDVLAPERELATRLRVSRPVVREVLRALAALGVIDIRHGYGSVVRQPEMAQLSDFFTLMLAQHRDGVDDIMEARIAIERQAIRLACLRATAGDIAALRDALAAIEQTVDDPEAGAEADFRFHDLMIAAAHSATLGTLHAAIGSLLRQSHLERRRRISGLPGARDYLIAHHRDLVAALAARDETEADAVLTRHFVAGSDLNRQGPEGA